MGETEVYRCADCGHGRHLMAYGLAVTYGPLGADGELERHDDVDDYDIQEGSICCTTHIDSVIEKQVNGVWCRFWNCPRCQGYGKVDRRTGTRGAWDGFECSEGIPMPRGGWGKIHEGWRPVAELAAEETGKRA